MSISIFDLFSIGVGPSSSHTVGPMRAANAFVQQLAPLLTDVDHVKVELYGSLALTGKGHGTDKAILNGLEAQSPESVKPENIEPRMHAIIKSQRLNLAGIHTITFNQEEHLLFYQKEVLPLHANGMRFSAYNQQKDILLSTIYYSVGGGFIVTEDEFDKELSSSESVPYPFGTAKELLALCKKNNLTIAELMLENEKTWQSEKAIHANLLKIVATMKACIEAGCRHKGVLPGGLNVKRRAPKLYDKLMGNEIPHYTKNQGDILHWINLYALAVNEENAAGGRIVTAPTNGAAGVIPAVLSYYTNFCEDTNEQGIIDFMLTAGAIAILYKKGASISAAEVGCQGEIGVACSMAAGALAAALGGTLEQIENAAEIGMEHNLGLTCDPIGGLVQIPCIERNAMGTVQAINAAQLALIGEGDQKVSLDTVIATMLQTGKDMKTTYKETSLGGLAVNMPEC